MFKPLQRAFNRYAERRARAYANRYIEEASARGEVPDPELIERITIETMRRGVMGYTLDVLEPAAWQTVALAAAAGLAAGQRLYVNHHDGKTTKSADVLIPAAFAAAGSAVNYLRLWERYNAGIEGGYDVALAVHDARARGVLSGPAADRVLASAYAALDRPIDGPTR